MQYQNDYKVIFGHLKNAFTGKKIKAVVIVNIHKRSHIGVQKGLEETISKWKET